MSSVTVMKTKRSLHCAKCDSFVFGADALLEDVCATRRTDSQGGVYSVDHVCDGIEIRSEGMRCVISPEKAIRGILL